MQIEKVFWWNEMAHKAIINDYSLLFVGKMEDSIQFLRWIGEEI